MKSGIDEDETTVSLEDTSGGLDVSFDYENRKAAEEEAEDEVEEKAVEPSESTKTEEPAKPTTKPKAKPRKQVRPAGKRAPKSTPAFFTGKAAGLPPPPKEACVGPPPQVEAPAKPVEMGAYLVYTNAEGGKLTSQWSKTALTGAGVLAYLSPEKEVGDYKFEKKSAIEIHATNLEVSMASDFPADRKKFYEGWATFIKQLSTWGGTLTLLPAAAAEPPPRVKIILFKGGKLTLLKVGQEVKINSFDSLAIVPNNAKKLDVGTMSPSDFMAAANSQGVYINLKK